MSIYGIIAISVLGIIILATWIPMFIKKRNKDGGDELMKMEDELSQMKEAGNRLGGDSFNNVIEDLNNALARGNYREAVSKAKLALSYDEENVLALLYAAAAHYGAQLYAEAIAYCHKVLSKEQDNPQALFYLAQSYMWLGDFKIAAEAFQKILEVDPNDNQQLRSKVKAGLMLALQKMK